MFGPVNKKKKICLGQNNSAHWFNAIDGSKCKFTDRFIWFKSRDNLHLLEVRKPVLDQSGYVLSNPHRASHSAAERVRVTFPLNR